MMIDEFTLVKSIGKGAFGEVYLTTKQGSPQLFATKKVSKQKADSPTIHKYFINEIKILQQIKHKNIIHFEAIKHTVHNYYIITEYCNGGGLSDCLKKYQTIYGRAFPEEIVQHLMRQIVDGMKYLHGLRIIHRDIKLDNILVCFDNEIDKNNLNLLKATIKIIDFGFATYLGSSNLRYSTLGSPINMDPVLLKKLTATNGISNLIGYDEKADIWSLGTVCYEMLIGQGVFNAQNMVELIKKVEFGNYHVPTNLSKEVVSFLNGMLQYSAKNRLSAEQLSRHYFLTKNISEFKHIDLTKVCHKIDGNGLNINIKRNQSIWAIFKEEDEKALIDIPGNYLNDLTPIPEICENPFKKANEKLKQEKKNNVVLNNQMPINNKNINNKAVNGINNLNKNALLNNPNEIDYELLRKQQKYYRQLNLKNHQHQRYANYVFNNQYPYGVANNNIYSNYNTVNGQYAQNKYYTANLQTNAKKQIKSQPGAPLQSATTQNNQVLINPQYQYTYTTQPQYITSVANPIVAQPQVINYGYYQPNSQIPSWQTQNKQENKIPQVQKPIIVPNPNDNKSKMTTKISSISSATTKTIPLRKTSTYDNKSYTYRDPLNQQKQIYLYQNQNSSKQLMPNPQSKQIKLRTDQIKQNLIPQTKIDNITDYKLIPQPKEQKKVERHPQQNGYKIEQKINQQPQKDYKVETKVIREQQNEYNLEPRVIRQPQNEYKIKPNINQEPQDKYGIEQKINQPQDKYKIETKIINQPNDQYQQPKYNNYNTNTTHIQIKKLPPETQNQNQIIINNKYHKNTYPKKPQQQLDLELNDNEEPKNNLKKLNKNITKDNKSQSNKNITGSPYDNWNINNNQYKLEDYKYEPDNQYQYNNSPFNIQTEPSPSPIQKNYNTTTSKNNNDLEFKDKDYIIVKEFNTVDIPINDNNKYNDKSNDKNKHNDNNKYNDEFNDKYKDNYKDKYNDKNKHNDNNKYNDEFNDKYKDNYNDKYNDNNKYNKNDDDKYNENNKYNNNDKINDFPVKKNSNEIKKKENDNDNESSSDLDDLIDFKLDDELCPEPENTEANKENDFDKEDLDSPINKYVEPTVERPTIGVPPPGTDPKDDFDFDNDDNGIFQTKHKKSYDYDEDY